MKTPVRKDQVDRLKSKCYCRLRQKFKSLLWSWQLAHLSTHGFLFFIFYSELFFFAGLCEQPLVLITNCGLDEFKTKQKFCGVCGHISGALMKPLPGNKDMCILNFTVVEIRLSNFFQKKDLIFINPSRIV